MASDEETQLYRHYDAKGVLLYVGISLSTISRLGQHKTDSHWFKSISKVTIEHFSNRYSALEAETKAIKTEKPLFNVVHNNSRDSNITTFDRYERENDIITNMVVWVDNDARKLMISHRKTGRPDRRVNPHHGHWCDPIGANYAEWHRMTNDDRVRIMLETAVDLVMNGFVLKDVLTVFAQVPEFKALGSKSYPMARALTSALLGVCLEPNTMSFDDLLVSYRRVG